MSTNGASTESTATGSAATGSTPSPLYDIATLYRDFAPRVCRWATRLTRSASDADDIVQEVFLIVHRRQPSINDVHSPSSWLLKVTLNVVRHHWRTRSRTSKREESWDWESRQDVTPTPLDRLQTKRAVEQLENAVESLDPRYKVVYLLCAIQQVPPVQVAEMTGIAPQTLRVRRFRARKQVAQRLSSYSDLYAA